MPPIDAPYVLVSPNHVDGAMRVLVAQPGDVVVGYIAPAIAPMQREEHPLDVMASTFVEACDRHGDTRAAMAEALGVLAITEIRSDVRGPNRQARRISAKRERSFKATLTTLIGPHTAPRGILG